MSIAEGAEFAGYLIERRLGSGGMGTVYLAKHPRLPRHDAIKILADDHAGDTEFRARFLREAELAAGLTHPNLVAVRDRGEVDGKLWIATQYVAGADAAELVRRTPTGLDPARAVHIIGEAARGLDAVHRAGLLHRDVKPANILVAEDPGKPDRVLVTDFGIARRAEDTATLSAGGGFTATLSYVSPEQLGGERVDLRADVYALGCSLFQLLTGSVPFPRQTPAAVMYAHLHEPPPRPSALRPGLPAGFDAVIARALAKDPAQRFDSCGALAAAAREAMHGSASSEPAAPTSASLPSSAPPLPPFGAAVGESRAGSFPDDPFAAVLLPRRTPFARLVRRRGFRIAVAAVFVVGIVTAAMLGTGGGTESSTNADVTTSPPPLPPATAWGVYSFVADLFPDLLPAYQLGVGYQEMSACYMIDDKGDHIPTDTLAPFARMRCEGNRDPAVSVTLECNTDRSLMLVPPSTDTVEGSEEWRRASGSGNLHWGRNTDLDGGVVGNLSIYFDDAARSFCRIRVVGGADGAELRERWWPDAPL
ncbi:serine/threonine-protein kinase [Nocardia caishijiensis]|uniref:non-specific serine/threonine protein kinase n=1 Tax=Nocardia caishijiensis TaxID=184756 RepID=A0ABQ6YJ25_9NOCA|nr:serine/threonine-protein kinase [Nocardia caishijiensis]KAF0845789.1 serine/threonine-protein kinase [Nocardia caishijiensis]